MKETCAHTHTYWRKIFIEPALNVGHGLAGWFNGVDSFVRETRVEETTSDMNGPYSCCSSVWRKARREEGKREGGRKGDEGKGGRLEV